MHKFAAERFGISPADAERIHSNLMNSLLLKHQPHANSLKDLARLGDYGEMMSGVIGGLKKCTVKTKDEKGQVEFSIEIGSFEELRQVYSETMFPVVQWLLECCDWADKTISDYVKEIDDALTNYCVACYLGNSECESMLSKVPLPKPVLELLRHGHCAGGASGAEGNDPDAFGELMVNLFVYFVLMRDAALPPENRYLNKLLEKGYREELASGFITETFKHLRSLGIKQEALIKQMGYPRRLYFKHKTPDGFLHPAFLKDFCEAYQALVKPHYPDMTDDVDQAFAFLLFSMQLLHVLDSLNCDGPVGYTPSGKQVTMHVKRECLQSALCRHAEYFEFAQNSLKARTCKDKSCKHK